MRWPPPPTAHAPLKSPPPPTFAPNRSDELPDPDQQSNAMDNSLTRHTCNHQGQIMQNTCKPHRAIAIAVALMLHAAASMAQAPQLPPPEATDPVKLELMKGFPPPPDKTVKL